MTAIQNHFEVNGKPAVKIFAKALVNKPGHNAILFDCEGDKTWLPGAALRSSTTRPFCYRNGCITRNLKPSSDED